MDKNLRLWVSLSLGLGAAMVLGGLTLLIGEANVPPFEQAGVPLVIGTGLALCGVAFGVLLLRRRVSTLLPQGAPGEEESTAAYARHRYTTLFLVSFVALFLEVMFIRYCSSQIRIFSFYRNVPLIASFLGLGLGCWLGAGGSRHALAFLLWLVPLAVFFSQGALVIDGYLGRWAALGSSEHILGDVIVREAEGGQELVSQLLMGLFCVGTLVAISALFTLLGRLLGDAFKHLPRLHAYTVNILGSLVGVMVFVALSYLQTPPWVWFLVGLSPLLWWTSNRSQVVASVAFITASTLAVIPGHGERVWSPYQKLVGHQIPPGEGGTGTDSPGYLVQISDVFYQVALDLRPQSLVRLGRNPFPHYDGVFRAIPKPERVLVVGAGTGNDVAAALRAGAASVVAVDIDPAIVELGRQHHPERPYQDQRVQVMVDDARTAFRRLPSQSYDAVVFGLLDSHTQLGISSVRLDNYVFTLESFASARRLLKPGGSIIITAATFREWFRNRLLAMLEATCDGAVQTSTFGTWTTYVCQVKDPSQSLAATTPSSRTLPTDDWPFLYLRDRGIPKAYLIVVSLLALASVMVLKAGRMDLGRFTAFHGHLFFLGAAFLLMEVYSINRLALLFGTTWFVSALTIAFVLTLIVCANATVALVKANLYHLAYTALVLSLLAGYVLEPAMVLGKGVAPTLGYALALLSPIYFAGLIFARSFRASSAPGTAMGANILGSALGGWAEYATMAVGIRAMVLLALVFYLGSLLTLLMFRKHGGAGGGPASA